MVATLSNNMQVCQLIQNSTLDKLEIKLLLRHILNLTPAQLIMHWKRELTLNEFTRFEQLCDSLRYGVPISYLLGYKEFYSYQFKVTPDTLIPRPETELLVDCILSFAKNGLRLLDLGTGSGVIAISTKLEYPKFVVDGVDKFIATLNVAKENAINLGADVNFYLSDWYDNISEKYDIIVSNPPYIAKDDPHLASLKYEPQEALTDFDNGLSFLKNIIQNASKYLNSCGILIVEHGFDQGSKVYNMYVSCGFSNVKTIHDYSGLDRITVGKLNV